MLPDGQGVAGAEIVPPKGEQDKSHVELIMTTSGGPVVKLGQLVSGRLHPDRVRSSILQFAVFTLADPVPL